MTIGGLLPKEKPYSMYQGQDQPRVFSLKTIPYNQYNVYHSLYISYQGQISFLPCVQLPIIMEEQWFIWNKYLIAH